MSENITSEKSWFEKWMPVIITSVILFILFVCVYMFSGCTTPDKYYQKHPEICNLCPVQERHTSDTVFKPGKIIYESDTSGLQAWTDLLLFNNQISLQDLRDSIKNLKPVIITNKKTIHDTIQITDTVEIADKNAIAEARLMQRNADIKEFEPRLRTTFDRIKFWTSFIFNRVLLGALLLMGWLYYKLKK